MLPKHLEKVARLHLTKIGAMLTELTPAGQLHWRSAGRPLQAQRLPLLIEGHRA